MSNPFRGAIAAALLSTAPVAALAQASPAASSPASTSARSTSSPTPAAQSLYKSAFDGYRRFDEQKVQRWRETNDNVGRIGGWQAYARESAGDEATPPPTGDHSQHKPAVAGQATQPAPAASTPGPSPAPVKAPAPVTPAAQPAFMPRDGYSGNGGHTMPKKP